MFNAGRLDASILLDTEDYFRLARRGRAAHQGLTMCLAVLALHAVPGIPVLIAANRDEFHAAHAGRGAWPDAAGIYAGAMLAGGTWMGA